MTFNLPGFRTIILLAAGFALNALSKKVGLEGDLADNPATRLFYHVSALLMVIAAIGCFIWALKTIFFEPAAKAAPPESTLQRMDIQSRTRDRDAGDAPVEKPRGFGRKGL